jgi:glycosyltransferase involved in cell wall biosynthesis
MSSPKISVVIPVYNGARFLPATLDSLRRQSFRDFEVLCINDCSPDNSGEILDQYARTDSRIRVLTTETNQGIVPKVLKHYAFPNFRGEYYTYSSQDDLFSEDWLERMWQRAVETGADAVLPDMVYFHESDRSKDQALIGVNGDRGVVLSHREAVILSLDWKIPGAALWRTEMARKAGCADFGMYADEYTARVFFFHANKVVFSGGVFYYRSDNVNAITRKPSYKQFDKPYTHFKLFEFLVANQFDPALAAQELMRAFSGVTTMKQDLMARRHGFTPDHRREAEQRLRFCYDAIMGSDSAMKMLKAQPGLRNRLRSALALQGYPLFGATCWVNARLRSLLGARAV